MRHICEVTADGCHASLDGERLCVRRRDGTESTMALCQILSVVFSSPRCTISNPLLARLATEGIPVVFVENDYQPSGILVSLACHSVVGRRMRQQANLDLTLAHTLWSEILHAKILNQVSVLGGDVSCAPQKFAKAITTWIQEKRVVALPETDIIQCEGVVAARYFPKFFGSNFTRGNGSREDAALNYAYATLLSCVSRAIASAGLNPVLGIGHTNPFNDVALACDLMEPFRPILDFWVRGSLLAIPSVPGETPLHRYLKARLVSWTEVRLPFQGRMVVARDVVRDCVSSFAMAIETKSRSALRTFLIHPNDLGEVFRETTSEDEDEE